MAAASVPSATTPSKQEGERGADEAVKRVGRVDIGKRDGRAGGGQHARYMRLGDGGESGHDLASARPFAGGDQSERDDAGEHDAGTRTEPALLDRVADQEEAAERERDAAGPHHPLRAKALLEADLRLCRSCGQRWFRRGNGRFWRGLGR